MTNLDCCNVLSNFPSPAKATFLQVVLAFFIPGKNVENLSQLEAKVKDLLQTIKKEKGAAIRPERKGKQNRRKLKRNEVQSRP